MLFFPLISSDAIFYFLIRKSKTMFINSVDFELISKWRKPPKWPERRACLCTKFDRLPSSRSKLSILCFEQTLVPIFSSAFNRFVWFWYQNLACYLSILLMSTLTRSSALIVNNTTGKFNDQNYCAPDHTACQLFRTQKKFKSQQRFDKSTKNQKESEKQLMNITFWG